MRQSLDLRIQKKPSALAGRIIAQNTKVIKPVKNQFDELIDHFRQLYIGRVTVDDDNNLVYQNEKFNLPIFINYGVNRLVLKTPLRINKKQSYGQFAAYEKAIENQIAFDRLFEWFLEQELYEIQLKKENKDYEDISLKAVKTASDWQCLMDIKRFILQ